MRDKIFYIISFRRQDYLFRFSMLNKFTRLHNSDVITDFERFIKIMANKQNGFIEFFCKEISSSCNCALIRGSSAEKGSSISKMSVSIAKALASPTLCCMPPESSCGYFFSQSESSTIASCSRAFLAFSLWAYQAFQAQKQHYQDGQPRH